MSYLGIDIGTSGCKVVAFNEDGRQLAEAYLGYSIESPCSGWAELNPQHVIDSCCEVIAQVCAKIPGDPVRALSISSQGEAFTPVDKNGRYLSNALVSSDSRAKELISPFTESFGLDKIYRITGHTPSTLFSLFKLLWIKHNKPELWNQHTRYYCFEDLLQLRLGVKPTMGWPLAGRTMLFDIHTHSWSTEIIDFIGLNENQLAQTLPSGAIVGTIPDSIANQLGMPSGVKVVTGGHDQTIAALGASVVKEGTAMYAAGTVECLCPVVSKLTLTDSLRENNLCSYDYSMPECYTSVAYSLTGSNLLQYFRNNFASENTYETLLKEMPSTPSNLFCLPYFTPSGTPYFDQDTPGTILGLRLSTSRGELLKGLMEGIGMEMKLNLSLLEQSGIQVDRLIATGGGARSQVLLQLKADILNKPIERIDINEAGCRGAANLAQSADMNVSVIDLVNRHNQPYEIIEPVAKNTAHYEDTFKQYKRFYSGINELAAEIRSMA